MKKHLKLLFSSAIIALTFASPQMIQGMEDFLKFKEQGVQSPYVPRISSGSDITEESKQKKKGHEEIRENLFKRCPKEIRFNILERVAIDNYLSNCNTGGLEAVCQDWRRIMAEDEMKQSVGSMKNEAIYQRFLKGVLIYRPEEESDVGRIDLPIAALGNPLEGTFDLSRCGDVGKHLSISTGYRKAYKAENAKKVEIWFAPRFLIEKELTTTAGHFQDIFIFGHWNDNAPVGIFWNYGGWKSLSYYDYLTTQRFDELSNQNLYEKWGPCYNNTYERYPRFTDNHQPYLMPLLKKFHAHFVKCARDEVALI